MVARHEIGPIRCSKTPRMLWPLKLHYVALTRPTHLLCLAARKDAFGEGARHLRLAAGRLSRAALPPKRSNIGLGGHRV